MENKVSRQGQAEFGGQRGVAAEQPAQGRRASLAAVRRLQETPPRAGGPAPARSHLQPHLPRLRPSPQAATQTPPPEPTGRAPTAVAKVTVTSRASGFGTFRRWPVARKRPAGVLPGLAPRADAGRQDAPSRPALARSLPPGFQTDAGSGAHPGGRLVPP